VVDEVEFRAKLAEHRFLQVVFFYLPREAIWRDELTSTLRWTVHKPTLYERSLEDRERDVKLAIKMMEKGNTEKGRKIYLATYREKEILLQIAEYGRITDLSAVNQHRRDVQDMHFDTPQAEAEFFADYYPSLFTTAEQQLLLLCQVAAKKGAR
jgi:hypothetical protein